MPCGDNSTHLWSSVVKVLFLSCIDGLMISCEERGVRNHIFISESEWIDVVLMG